MVETKDIKDMERKIKERKKYHDFRDVVKIAKIAEERKDTHISLENCPLGTKNYQERNTPKYKEKIANIQMAYADRLISKKNVDELNQAPHLLNNAYQNILRLYDEKEGSNDKKLKGYINAIQKRANRTFKIFKDYDGDLDLVEKGVGDLKELQNLLDNTKGKIAKREKPAKKSLLSKLFPRRVTTIIASAFLLAGLFFLSSNLTGNVVGNLSKGNSNWIGGILFLLGIVGVFMVSIPKKNCKRKK